MMFTSDVRHFSATVAAERIDITLDIVPDPEMNQLLRGYSGYYFIFFIFINFLLTFLQ